MSKPYRIETPAGEVVSRHEKKQEAIEQGQRLAFKYFREYKVIGPDGPIMKFWCEGGRCHWCNLSGEATMNEEFLIKALADVFDWGSAHRDRAYELEEALAEAHKRIRELRKSRITDIRNAMGARDARISHYGRRIHDLEAELEKERTERKVLQDEIDGCNEWLRRSCW